MLDLKRFAATAAVLLIAAVGGAAAWVSWASPAEWEVREQGIVLTEAASVGAFNVVATFTLIGAVISLVWGWWAERRHRDVGWIIVVFVIAVPPVAAILMWQLGVAWGPPDPASVEGLAVGDTVPSQFKVDSVAPFVVWSIVAVLGSMLSTWFRANDDADPELVF